MSLIKNIRFQLTICQSTSILVSSKSSSEVLDTPQSGTCSKCKKKCDLLFPCLRCPSIFATKLSAIGFNLGLWALMAPKSRNLLALFFPILSPNDEFWEMDNLNFDVDF